MNVGEKIREYRIQKGLTQKELGVRCGIAESTIRRYELGKLNPKINTIKKITEGLKIPLYEFLNSTDLEKIGNFDIKTIIGYYEMVDADNARKQKYLDLYAKLNDEGQIKAIERIEELTQIKEYTIDYLFEKTQENFEE